MPDRPFLVIVVPNGGTPADLLEAAGSWLALRRSARIHFVLVTSKAGPIPRDLQDCVSLKLVRRPVHWRGRDANLRRQAGLEDAVAFGADAILFTDAKVRATPETIARLERWIGGQVDSVPVLAGHYLSSPDEDRFLALYGDHAALRKNPDFSRSSRWLAQDNTSANDSWPVTGALALNRGAAESLLKSGGIPIEFNVSYEDYSTVQRLLETGVRILCDQRFTVVHRNRADALSFCREWLRTGWAAAQFRQTFRSSPLGKRRALQAWVLAGALLSATALMLKFPLMMVAAMLVVIALFGLWSWAKCRRTIALAFGVPFLVACSTYALGYVWFKCRGGHLGSLENRVFSMG